MITSVKMEAFLGKRFFPGSFVNQNAARACYFDWNFSDALVRPADSWISIDAPLVDGLTPRVCYDVDAGTFDVRGMLWQLSWPLAYRF